VETVPKSTSLDLASYLQRQFNRLDLAIQNVAIQKLNTMPEKPVVGKIYYFNVVIAPTITSEGMWTYKSTGWSYLG
jgi:hypothetical protein